MLEINIYIYIYIYIERNSTKFIYIYIYILKEIAQNLLVMQNKVMLFYLLILCGKK